MKKQVLFVDDELEFFLVHGVDGVFEELLLCGRVLLIADERELEADGFGDEAGGVLLHELVDVLRGGGEAGEEEKQGFHLDTATKRGGVAVLAKSSVLR